MKQIRFMVVCFEVKRSYDLQYKEHSGVKPQQLSAKGDRREGGTAEKVN